MRTNRQHRPADELVAELHDEAQIPLAKAAHLLDDLLNTVALERPVVSNLVNAARCLRDCRTYLAAGVVGLEATAAEEELG